MPKATADELADTIYLRALGHAHTAGELAGARDLVGSPPTPEGLADLLLGCVRAPRVPTGSDEEAKPDEDARSG